MTALRVKYTGIVGTLIADTPTVSSGDLRS